MIRFAFRTAAVIVVALGLLFVLPGESSAFGTQRSKSSKTKDSDEKATRKRRASNDSSKRTKSGDDDKKKDTKSSDSQKSNKVEPVVVSRAGSPSDLAADEEDDEEEPEGPKPANRLVASIGSGRVIEIQAALKRNGFFSGEPSGVWDQSTFDSMTAFQRQRGFGATGMPTAESLKALGVRKNSGIGIYNASSVIERTSAIEPAPRDEPGEAPVTMSGPPR